MARGLSKEDIANFDHKLKFYCWPVVTNYAESALERLAKTENFNANNYEEAVAIYIYWKQKILPTVEKEEQDGHHLCFGQQVYNILHLYAPEHHIHLALRN